MSSYRSESKFCPISLTRSTVNTSTSGVPIKTHPEHHQIGVEQFLEMLMLKTQSLIPSDGHDMVDDNSIVFNNNVVHQ